MPPKGSTRKKKSSTTDVRLKELDKVAEAEKAQHLKAPNTAKKYHQNVAAARKWLQGHFDPVQGEKTARCQPQDTAFEPDADPTDAFVHPDFQKAFDRVPNQFSAKALALYLTFQCFNNGKKAGTGASARAAFKHFWEQSAGSTYRGKWEQNPVTKEWQGNPVESVDVADVMTAIKHKTSAEGGDRTHSMAMSEPFMGKMWKWSRTQCDISAPVKSVEERALKTKHLGFETFAKVAWQLWARCGEVCKIKRKDVTLNCVNEKAFGLLYHRIHLRERKGWQRKLSKTEREADPHSHVYHIYDAPDLPACNAYQALNQWFEHLEQDHGRKTAQRGSKYDPGSHILTAGNIETEIFEVTEKPRRTARQSSLTCWYRIRVSTRPFIQKLGLVNKLSGENLYQTLVWVPVVSVFPHAITPFPSTDVLAGPSTAEAAARRKPVNLYATLDRKRKEREERERRESTRVVIDLTTDDELEVPAATGSTVVDLTEDEGPPAKRRQLGFIDFTTGDPKWTDATD